MGNKNDKKGLVASSEDLFSSSNDDPFWKSNTVQTGQSSPNKVDRIKSISVEHEDDNQNGDDLMDFFSSSSPTNNVTVNVDNGFGDDPFGNDKTLNTVSMNERNRLKQKDFNHQQQQQNNDPFNSFGNGNNGPFFNSNSNQNNNGNVFGQNNNVFNNNSVQTNNGFNNNVFGQNNSYNNNAFGSNVFNQSQNNNAFNNNPFGNNQYMANNNNGFNANVQQTKSDPFDLLGF